MPKINRIRIVNFYYNNDSRHIADETYSFYGGENALLNLANGGGKSVLIQLMLQPLIPDLKLQNRSMMSYFKKSSYPAFIMLEWLLDNDVKKDYLMTGISIAPRSSADENSGNRINFFTFTSHYDSACDFDIAMVPFVKTEGEKQVILSFDRSREEVKKAVGKSREMRYFSRDEASAYRQHLSSFGISQEEWKTIISKMNNDEGGIEELFEKCKTSDSVLNEWIIKTVERVVQSDNDEVQIQDLFEGLVADTVRNKEYINDQKIIKEYFEEHIKLEDSLGKVCEKLDKVNYIEDELNCMRYCMYHAAENIDTELNNLNAEKDELSELKTHIYKEEISHNYYEAEETYLECRQEEKDSKEELEKAKKELNLKIREKNINEAARIFSRCNELRGNISGLNKSIEKEKYNAPVTDRLDSLKYSLKVIYKNKKAEIDRQIIKRNDLIYSNKEKLSKLTVQLSENRKALNECIKEESSLETKIDIFKDYEKTIFKDLDICFDRNLLEETDEKDMQKALTGFIAKQDKLVSEKESLVHRMAEIENRKEEIHKENFKISLESQNLSNQLEVLNKEYQSYKKEKEECLKILSMYEIPANQIYDNLSILKILDNKIINLDKEVLFAENEEHQLSEMIDGIVKGRVYHPESLLNILDENDIYYKTGENYLNNLTEHNRKILLENDPMLPFSIIIDKKELDLIKKVSLQNAFLRQIIPVVTYDKLEISLNDSKIITDLNEKYSLLSAYEPKIFMDIERERYLNDLKAEIEKIKDRKQHFKIELDKIRDSKETVKRFTYAEDYEGALLNKLEVLSKNIENINETKNKLGEESTKLHEVNLLNSKQIKIVDENTEKVKKHISMLHDYLEKNKNYMQDWKKYNKLISDKKLLELKIKENDIEKERLNRENTDFSVELSSISHLIDDINKKLLLYSDAAEKSIIEGALEELEKEYNVLIEQQNSSISSLEEKLMAAKKDLEEKEKELCRLKLELHEYEDVVFDETKYDRLDEEIRLLTEMIDKKQVEYLKSSSNSSRAEGIFKMVIKALNAQNMTEPLDKSEIKGDYENRLKDIKFKFDIINNNEKKYTAKKNQYNNYIGYIDLLVEEKKVKIKDFTLNEDIKKQYDYLKANYNDYKKAYENAKSEYVKLLNSIKSGYYDKHQSIADILNSIDTLNIDNAEYDSAYYYYEELSKKRESLSKYLSFYEQQLQNVEHTKKQVIDQCLSYAAVIYDDIKSIAEKSRVKLSSRNKYVKMIKIDIPEKTDDYARNRMEEHISSSVKAMVEIYEDGNDTNIKKIRDKIKGIISTRELLNQLIGTAKIPVSVYKVDLSEKNSGLKKWEEAISENSGGEKFVVFFTLVSVLISYTRDATIRRMAAGSFKESKVIIMDNPFGKTSSEHLLKAIIDIACTFNIQLICLSDLSQSSITNRFSLIYRLCIRKRMYSDTEVLKIDELTINKQGLSNDERLEHAMIHQISEQENMFDLFDNM